MRGGAEQAGQAIQFRQILEIGRDINELQRRTTRQRCPLPTQQCSNRGRVDRSYMGEIDLGLAACNGTQARFQYGFCIVRGQ